MMIPTVATHHPTTESLQDWLPEDHLARFVVDIVDGLDLSALERAYSGGGKQPYHPAVLLSLLFYGYATGVFSSQKTSWSRKKSTPRRGLLSLPPLRFSLEHGKIHSLVLGDLRPCRFL